MFNCVPFGNDATRSGHRSTSSSCDHQDAFLPFPLGSPGRGVCISSTIEAQGRSFGILFDHLSTFSGVPIPTSAWNGHSQVVLVFHVHAKMLSPMPSTKPPHNRLVGRAYKSATATSAVRVVSSLHFHAVDIDPRRNTPSMVHSGSLQHPRCQPQPHDYRPLWVAIPRQVYRRFRWRFSGI